MIQQNRRKLLIGIIALIVVAAGVFFLVTKTSLWPTTQQVATGEPVDVVLDFYVPWLEALQATSTDPYQMGLAKSPVLSKAVRQQILAAKGHADTEPDPVLCQTTVPVQLAARPVSLANGVAQVLVVSRDKANTEQAVVTLTQLGEGWYISGIACSPGEFGPKREFSFDTEGYLLKSVLPPLNPKFWHLVFVENGEAGHVVPLYFAADSTCTALNGTAAVCDPAQLVEAMKAHVRGEMTETGVKVKKLELVKE